ncbi:hypothetical protein SUGI_1203220 [Cryptomeria japonica]|nr:hypothetical protein SUGI_1203220 [Cryptomeria japonica]
MLLEGALQELCQKQQYPLPFCPSASVPFQWEAVSDKPKITVRSDPLVISSPLRDCTSVPFQGVEVPGKTQQKFMNDPLGTSFPSSHTNRAVAAVPFKWEEKPGQAKPFFPNKNPISSSITLSQKSFNSSHVDDSPKFSPRTLSERLRSIFQVKLSRPTKLSSAKTSLPIQNAYNGQCIEERGAEEVLTLNFSGGSEGEEEMFELDLNAPSSLGSERRFSSLAGDRTGASDAATPSLLANCLMNMMEISKAVPVEESFKQNMCLPSLVSVDPSDKEDSWDTMKEIQSKDLMSGYQQCPRFYSLQPASSPKGISSTNVYDSPKHIGWEGTEVICGEEDEMGTGTVDVPCLDLGFKDEKLHQLRSNGNNGSHSSSSSSSLASTFDFVEGRSPQSVTQCGDYCMDIVPFGTCTQSGKHSNCNQGTAKFKHPSKEPSYFQENPMFDAKVEETKAVDFIGRYGQHSKRTGFRPKRQTLCMVLKFGMISSPPNQQQVQLSWRQMKNINPAKRFRNVFVVVF